MIRVAARHNLQDRAGFWFVCKAHPPAHFRINAAGCNTPDTQTDRPKLKQDAPLFLAEALSSRSRLHRPIGQDDGRHTATKEKSHADQENRLLHRFFREC
jgi:hypothetical protein